MKEYTTRQKMVETVELTSTTCDLCGKKAYYNQEWSGGYDVAETEIRFKEGTQYPEGGSGTETTIDICPDCFKDKLIPWVKSQGGEPTVREWDW